MANSWHFCFPNLPKIKAHSNFNIYFLEIYPFPLYLFIFVLFYSLSFIIYLLKDFITKIKSIIPFPLFLLARKSNSNKKGQQWINPTGFLFCFYVKSVGQYGNIYLITQNDFTINSESPASCWPSLFVNNFYSVHTMLKEFLLQPCNPYLPLVLEVNVISSFIKKVKTIKNKILQLPKPYTSNLTTYFQVSYPLVLEQHILLIWQRTNSFHYPLHSTFSHIFCDPLTIFRFSSQLCF